MQRLCLSMNVLYQLIVIPILGHWLGVLVAKGMGWPLSEIAGYTIVPTLSVIVIAILVPGFVRQSETNQKNLSQGPRASFGKPGARDACLVRARGHRSSHDRVSGLGLVERCQKRSGGKADRGLRFACRELLVDVQSLVGFERQEHLQSA